MINIDVALRGLRFSHASRLILDVFVCRVFVEMKFANDSQAECNSPPTNASPSEANNTLSSRANKRGEGQDTAQLTSSTTPPPLYRSSPPTSTPAIIYPGLAGLLVHPQIDSFSDAPRIQGQPVTYAKDPSYAPQLTPPTAPPTFFDYSVPGVHGGGPVTHQQFHNCSREFFSSCLPSQATKLMPHHHQPLPPC